MLSQSEILDQMKKELPPESRAARQAEFARKMCYDLEKGLVTEAELSNIVNSLCRRVIEMSKTKDSTGTGSSEQQKEVGVGMDSFASLMNTVVLEDSTKADAVSNLSDLFHTGQNTSEELGSMLKEIQGGTSGD